MNAELVFRLICQINFNDFSHMKTKNICKWYNVCPMKRYFEEGKLDKKWVEEYCWSNYQHCVRKKMEEEGQYHPDNMLPDGTINKKLKM